MPRIARSRATTAHPLPTAHRAADIVATASRDGSVCLFDLRVSPKRAFPDGLSSTTHAMADVDTLNPISRLQCHSTMVGDAVVDAHGGVSAAVFVDNFIVSAGSADAQLKFWDLRALPSSSCSRLRVPGWKTGAAALAAPVPAHRRSGAAATATGASAESMPSLRQDVAGRKRARGQSPASDAATSH
ncbi:hypothetical protein EON62_04535, partial [archaeon]